MCPSVFWAAMCSIVHMSFQQSIVPVLTIPAGKTVVTLNEKPTQQEELVRGITCTGNGAVRVFMRSVAPSSPCGACFAVWPDKGVYALYFNPSQGSLNYTQVTSYTVQVECTDDVSSVSASIEVRLWPNSPPTFVTPATSFDRISVTNADTKRVGSVIYEAAATDPDGDAVFYRMETLPDIGLFEIGDTDGRIRTSGDLRYLCATSAEFSIYTFDAYNDPVGPRTVQAEFRFREDPGTPVITNTETVLEQPEDPDDEDPALNAVKDFELKTTPRNAKQYNWKMTADPARGLEYYVLDVTNGKVKAKKRLDYEYDPLRSVTLYLTANNGFCESETYSVRINLTDVNELPLVFPDGTKTVYIERTVYEGLISFHPNVTATDPDLDENLKWTLRSPSVEFHVDATTGIIYSTGEFDVDKNTEYKTRTLQLVVEDKEGERATLIIKLTILDKNDNAPQFTQPLFERSATACSPVGRDLPPKLNAIDSDSSFQGNNKLVFSGRGNKLAVTGTGHVILTKQCTAGERETLSVNVEDQGTYPGTLQGIPCTVALVCNECPTTTTAVITTTTTP